MQRAVDAAQHRGATCDGVLDEIDPDKWGQNIGIFKAIKKTLSLENGAKECIL